MTRRLRFRRCEHCGRCRQCNLIEIVRLGRVYVATECRTCGRRRLDRRRRPFPKLTQLVLFPTEPCGDQTHAIDAHG